MRKIGGNDRRIITRMVWPSKRVWSFVAKKGCGEALDDLKPGRFVHIMLRRLEADDTRGAELRVMKVLGHDHEEWKVIILRR